MATSTVGYRPRPFVSQGAQGDPAGDGEHDGDHGQGHHGPRSEPKMNVST